MKNKSNAAEAVGFFYSNSFAEIPGTIEDLTA
jgi:hypothetical protein